MRSLFIAKVGFQNQKCIALRAASSMGQHKREMKIWKWKNQKAKIVVPHGSVRCSSTCVHAGRCLMRGGATTCTHPPRHCSFLFPCISYSPWASGRDEYPWNTRLYLMRSSLSFSDGWSSSHWEKRAWDHSALWRLKHREVHTHSSVNGTSTGSKSTLKASQGAITSHPCLREGGSALGAPS